MDPAPVVAPGPSLPTPRKPGRQEHAPSQPSRGPGPNAGRSSRTKLNLARGDPRRHDPAKINKCGRRDLDDGIGPSPPVRDPDHQHEPANPPSLRSDCRPGGFAILCLSAGSTSPRPGLPARAGRFAVLVVRLSAWRLRDLVFECWLDESATWTTSGRCQVNSRSGRECPPGERATWWHVCSPANTCRPAAHGPGRTSARPPPPDLSRADHHACRAAHQDRRYADPTSRRPDRACRLFAGGVTAVSARVDRSGRRSATVEPAVRARRPFRRVLTVRRWRNSRIRACRPFRSKIGDCRASRPSASPIPSRVDCSPTAQHSRPRVSTTRR